MGPLPQDLTRYVVLVTGKEKGSFGTAFAIHRDTEATYLLTCQHVVEKVGGVDGLLVHQQPATMLASDNSDDFDLAVLRVEQQLDIPLLEIAIATVGQHSFRTVGFHDYGKSTLLQPIEGRIGKQTEIHSHRLNCQCPAWYLEVHNDEQLQHGYSGAPLLDDMGKVIGFISNHHDKGRRGLAFSIETLRHVWQHMPELIARQFQPTFASVPVAVSGKLPLMNLNDERALFKRIASGEDAQTRLIVVNGESGLGKTRFLEECNAIAASYHLPIHEIRLGQQTSVEQFLDQVVFRLGAGSFQRYEQSLLTANSTSLADRERTLARAFISDLNNLTEKRHLVLFLDQFEKPYPEFKKWFTTSFAPLVSAQPYTRLIMVVAGQEPITAEEAWTGYHPIQLKRLEVELFHKFVQDCKVNIPPDDVTKFHRLLHGVPKLFVDYVTSLLQTQGAL